MASVEMSLDDFDVFLQRQAADLANLDFTVPFHQAAVMIRSDVAENFAGAHAPDGAAWAPLKFPRPNGGDKPLRDTGILMASVTSPVGESHVENITAHELTVGTNLDYAGIHQHGGTIVPTSGKALAIPLTKEAKKAGNPRDGSLPGLFLFKGHNHGFLATSDQKGRGRKQYTVLTLHYILLASVTIPARPFLGFSEALLGRLEILFGEFLTSKLGAIS